MALQPHTTLPMPSASDKAQRYLCERTAWGWMHWSLPTPDAAPLRLLQIGIRTPESSARARYAHRWLTRRPPTRLYLDNGGSVTGATLLTAVCALFAMAWALGRGLPVSIALPLAILLPLLVDHLPACLDTRARRYVRIIDADPALEYVQRLAARHTRIVEASEASSLPELGYAVQLGHRVLWAIAPLATALDPSPDSQCRLLSHESLLTELARQAADVQSAQHSLDHAITPPRTPRCGIPIQHAGCPTNTTHPDRIPAQAVTETATQLGHIAVASRYATQRLRSIDTPVSACDSTPPPSPTTQAPPTSPCDAD